MLGRGRNPPAKEDVAGVFRPDTNTRNRPKTYHHDPPYAEHTYERGVMYKLL